MKISVTLSPELRLEQALIQAGTTDPATVSHLTVAGMLTDVDFGYIRKNMRETLHELDISNASVVVDLEQALENVRHEKRVAVKRQNFTLAARFRDAEKVFEKLKEAKAKWEQKQDLSKNCMILSDEKIVEVIATITGVPVQHIAQLDNPLIFKVINNKTEQ